ncbi:MAG TPA: 30S ribosome-binding factor RbfA [Acidimicrobiales bacterium]|nr:30S ribosome-binding factor RbfA [Acidimicrobiales bacterium]
MARHSQRHNKSARRFDRSDRLNELLTRILAEEIELIDDDRLTLATITGVSTDRDLTKAKVYVTGISDDENLLESFNENRQRFQHAIGSQSRLRRVPQLNFMIDETGRSAERIEEILRDLEIPSDE